MTLHWPLLLLLPLAQTPAADFLPPGALLRFGATRPHHDAPALAVAVTPDCQRLASTGTDGTVRLWDAMTGKQIPLAQPKGGTLGTVALAPDGKTLAARHGNQVLLWDVVSGKQTGVLKDQPGPNWPLTFGL